MRKFWTILFLWMMSFHITSAQTLKNNGPSKLPVINATASELPIPVYPESAKAVCAAGLVEIKVATDQNGKVIISETISGHQLLIEPALAAARNAKFRVREGVPVVGKLVYNFDGVMIKACEIKIYVNTLNDRAKTLPMPRLANSKDIHIATPVKVRVDINLQTGTVIDAKIESGHPFLNAAALRAAKLATFKPVLQEFPWVTGVGHISYRLADFNKKTVTRTKPLSLPIIQRDVLNSSALAVPKPDPVPVGKKYIAGRVEVTVLVDAMEGILLASRMVSGPEELRATSEKAAMLVKFNVAHIDGDGSRIYVVGKILYTFKENGKVE